MATVSTQNYRGEWVPAIPGPFLGLRKTCRCGRKFWTMEGYQGHYAYAHALGMVPPPGGLPKASSRAEAAGSDQTEEAMSEEFENSLPDHLRDDAPYVVCSACGRKSWTPGAEGERCDMPQPNGERCQGVFEAAA
jgi:hypothetical protein